MRQQTHNSHRRQMREKKYKELDGFRYRCDMMPCLLAHRTFLTLCATLGRPVIKAIVAGSDDLDQDATKLITTAIGAAFQNLEGEVGDKLVESVFNGVVVQDGEKVVDLKPWRGESDGGSWNHEFEHHFKGRVFSMYKIWAWSIEVNYGDFLDGLQDLGGDKAKGLVKDSLNSLLTSTSESGASQAPS